MDEFGLISSLAIALGAALVGDFVARVLKQSPIVGHLIAGVIIGPFVLKLISQPEEILVLASIGVVVLLFTLGVRFSFKEMAKVRKVAIWGGLGQIFLSLIAGVGISYLFDFSLTERLVFGITISFSSTMAVLAMLSDRGELDTLHGRILIGVLLLQDLAVTFAMFLFPALKDSGESLFPRIPLALLQGGLFIILVLLFGTKLIPRIFKGIASKVSRELMVMGGAALCFGGAFLAFRFGLSAAIGAFAFGLVFSQSDFTHQLLGEMTPLRDIFSALFFVSMGMLIDLSWVWENLPVLILIVVLVVVLKFLIFSLLVRLFRYRRTTALLSGAGIVSVGEFSFVLAELGRNMGVISPQVYMTIISLATLTLILAPLIYGFTSSLTRRFSRALEMEFPEEETVCSSIARAPGHVILGGCGRVGRNIAQLLFSLKYEFLVIEIDPFQIGELRAKGIPAIFGDVGNREVLKKAGIVCASLLLLAVPDPISARQAISWAKKLNPEIKIVARAHSDYEASFLKEMGVSVIVQPEAEASFEIARHSLIFLGFPEEEATRIVNSIRD
jgi:CPA2 family monovalent cation:H+ antiporter-2